MNKLKMASLTAILGFMLTVLFLSCSSSGVPEVPKSIVLIIADGTGIGQHTLSYYFNGSYAPARFDVIGLMTTHPADSTKVTDSAASGTAMATGYKTHNGAVGVDGDHNPITTVLEKAIEMNLATGIISTSSVTHATPASFTAHVPDRGEYREIARQISQTKIDVVLGGGLKHFQSEEQGGLQERDLLAALDSSEVQVIKSLDEKVASSMRVYGLFADVHMPPATERSISTADMSAYALGRLSNDPDGFFLMIEESQVDWGGHANSADYVLGEMASLNEVVNVVLDFQSGHPEVLVILTADHETGGLGVIEAISGAGLTDAWLRKGHTQAFVPVFATGPGARRFGGIIDNTDIGNILMKFIETR